MASPLPRDSKNLPYFYLHLRHPPNSASRKIVAALSKSLKGPFFKVPSHLREPSYHKFYLSKINQTSFEYFKNLRVSIESNEQRDFYLNNLNGFALDGHDLEMVSKPDEIYSILVDSSKDKQPPTAINVNRQSSNANILNSKSKTSNLLNLEPNLNINDQISTGLNPRNGQLPSTSSLPVNRFTLSSTQPDLNSTSNYAYIYRNSPNEYVNIPVQMNNDMYNLNKIDDIVTKLKKDGLSVFDPIRFNVYIWIDSLEFLLQQNNCLNLFNFILPNFLEKVSLYLIDLLRYKKKLKTEVIIT